MSSGTLRQPRRLTPGTFPGTALYCSANVLSDRLLRVNAHGSAPVSFRNSGAAERSVARAALTYVRVADSDEQPVLDDEAWARGERYWRALVDDLLVSLGQTDEWPSAERAALRGRGYPNPARGRIHL